jgi:hypothetical protein
MFEVRAETIGKLDRAERQDTRIHHPGCERAESM